MRVLLLAGCWGTSFGQSVPSTFVKVTPLFGTISDAEHALTPPADEPNAEAIIVFDIGSSRFQYQGDGGFVIIFKRIKRIKVFTRAGARHAEVSIPFYFENKLETEKVYDIEAMTHNYENGQIIMRRLEGSSIYEEQISEHVKVKKFVMPHVKENTVFEFRYTMETPFLFNPPDWKFQGNIPTKYSEYSIGTDPFYEYEYIAQGIDKFDYQHSGLEHQNWKDADGKGNYTVTTFVKRNIPAFVDEGFITTPEDYIMKLDFQVAKVTYRGGGYKFYKSTWTDLCKRLLEHEDFGRYINASHRLAKDILKKEPQLMSTPENKRSQAIINYVRSELVWTGRMGYYASKSPKEVFAQKTGTAAEINLLLMALLSEAGFDATPVLLSTRSHGKVYPQYPFDHFFNYVLVFVNGPQPFLTDGTESLIAYDRIPIRSMNEKGLIVSKEAENWVDLTTRRPSLEDVNLKLTVDPANSEIRFSSMISSTEYEALDYRRNFEDDTTKIREHFQKTLDVPSLKASTYNFSTASRPYIINLTGTSRLEQVGSKAIVQPFLGFAFNENPLKQPERTYPVDITYPRNTKIKTTVFMPNGYKPSALPEPIELDNEMVLVSLKHAQIGSDLELQAEYRLKKAVYDPAEYSKVKEYFDVIIKAFNATVVLEKQ